MPTTKLTLSGLRIDLSSCTLLDKVPAEVRVRIYAFLFSNSHDEHAASADDRNDRRLQWKLDSTIVPTSTGVSAVVRTSSIEPSARARHSKPLDISIFRTCKQVYKEAQFELISKSTVIMQITHIRELVQYPNLLAQICRIEIRDSRHSAGPQVMGIPGTEDPPAPFEAHHRRALGITHLGWIRALLDKAPLLTRIVIGFEVLRLNMPGYYSCLEGGDIDSQILGMSVESGFGVVDCDEVGIWRFREELFQGVEIKHFNVVAAFEKLIREQCDCHMIGLGRFGLAVLSVRRRSVEAQDLVMRHVMGRDGVLGEEARKHCRGRETEEPMSMFKKTLRLLEDVVRNTDNF